MDAVIRTDRLELRPVEASDFGDMCALWADEDFTRFVTPQPLTPEEVWLRLLRDVGHWRALGYGNWAMRLREGGAFVGAIGVFDFRRAISPALDAPELGWGVTPGRQRQGFAREGLKAALDWCDRSGGVDRTVCIIHPENAPSLSLARTAGYAPYERTEYKGGPVLLLERARPSP